MLGTAGCLLAHHVDAQIVQFSGAGGSNNGFTQINIELDAGGNQPNTSVPSAQQGSGYSGNGSRVVYVSYSSGNDGNTGTLASPVKTKAQGLTLLRSGKPDQMLCKCGDTWPASDTMLVEISGASAGTIGQVCTGPILFGFYGSGNRPLHEVDETAAEGGGVALDLGVNPCNNLAFIGWEWYAPTRDPTASTYTVTGASSNISAITTYNITSPSDGIGPTWLLIEDCRASWFGNTFSLQGINNLVATNGATSSGETLHFSSVPSWITNGVIALHLNATNGTVDGVIPYGTTVTGTTSTTVTLSNNVTGGGVGSGDDILFLGLSGTVALRRCLIYCAYSFDTYNLTGGGHAQAVYMSCLGSPIVDSCAIAYGGWNPVLVTPQSCTSSSSTFTWPLGSLSGGAGYTVLPFGNGASLFVSATAGGLTKGTNYFAINCNSSAGTFQLSTTSGGSAVTVTNGTYSLMFADAALNALNHNLYLDDTCGLNNAVVENNMWLYSSNVMVRTAGTITGNYVSYHSNDSLIGGVQNDETGPGFVAPIATKCTISGNVVQHPGDTIQGTTGSAPNFPPASDTIPSANSGIGLDLENINGGTITNNIFSQSTGATANSTGIVNFCGDGDSDIVENTSMTGNIFYNWNDSIGILNNNSNSGTGNTTTPNTTDGVTSYPASNTEGYLHPTRDLTTYDSDILGGAGTAADAISQMIGVTTGGGRGLQSWTASLTPANLVSYIFAGFQT